MRRVLAFGALWLVATAATGAVAWGAVRLAGEGAGDQALRPLTVQQVQALGTSTTAAGPETTPGTAPSTTASVPASGPTTSAAETTPPEGSPTSTTALPAAARQTRGGTVVVSLAGTRLSLVSATPAAGYTVEVEEAGPNEVRVVFEGAGEEIEVQAQPEGGRVTFSVEEQTAEGD